MSETESKHVEKRISPRAKISRMLRVRPSDPDVEHFDEILATVNVSKRGIYFHTHRQGYYVGMRLVVTYPFTFEKDPTQAEYLAEIVRIEKLTDSRVGVAVHLIMK